MLRPINTAEAVALAGDLAGLTDPSDAETVRLCRLAVHYRDRIAELEAALRKIRSYNVDIAAERINYRPEDHIAVIDAALSE